MKKIAFHSGQLGLLGTEIALYDYAHFNETILRNKSIIIYAKNAPNNDERAIEKFKSRFSCFAYNTWQEVDPYIKEQSIDLLYVIKAGSRDITVSKVVPTSVHAVFPVKREEAHGEAYAFVSNYISREHSNNKTPFVPHIVHFPKEELNSTNNMRKELNIPEDATVFGYYGGLQSLNVRFVKERVVPYVLNKRNDVYFIFMNIDKFINHPRVIFLNGSSNIDVKANFIRTCDAMVHGRKIGETFGLSIGEFSLFNKPVFIYSLSPLTHHLDTLGEKAQKYTLAFQLKRMLLEFDKNDSSKQNWDCYSEEFSPEKVMQKFKEFFIDAPLNEPPLNRLEKMTAEDALIIKYNSLVYFLKKKIANLGSSLTI